MRQRASFVVLPTKSERPSNDSEELQTPLRYSQETSSKEAWDSEFEGWFCRAWQYGRANGVQYCSF